MDYGMIRGYNKSMTPQQKKELSLYLTQNGLTLLVAMSLDTGKKYFIGSFEELKFQSIVNALFDLEPQSVKEYLEGMVQPRMVQQGIVNGLVFTIDDNTAIGIYYHDNDRDVIEASKFCKQIAADVKTIWKKIDNCK